MASHIVRLAELSFRMEADRRESLAAASGRLLTCISVLSIALLTALPVLTMSQLASLIAIEYAFVFLLALASFGFALVAHYRFKYREPLSPQMLANHVMTEKDSFREAEDAATRYAGILEEQYQSIRCLNDRLSKLLRVSTVLLGISIALVLVFGVLDAAVLVVFVELGEGRVNGRLQLSLYFVLFSLVVICAKVPAVLWRIGLQHDCRSTQSPSSIRSTRRTASCVPSG